ncbi:MAG: nucleotidyl transferase AbiEii/AbiGii toxin family protein [Alphaproteobacteria bacterium]|nr:nucleotidyl transferase AbiEii/AbiGii toxin family protein [Alphaproteobacteria bacterium]MCB9690439.1 nucleotidyl transferase AbiEii/AbiGii toxin family protein [Alphaproteobacteria bacterium]
MTRELTDIAASVRRRLLDRARSEGRAFQELATFPAPYWLDYPELLDLGAPRLLGYPPEATLAEKLHAIVVLGFANSRMKDCYDLWTAARPGVVTGEGVGEALTAALAEDPTKQAQWAGFGRKSRLDVPTLAEVVDVVAGLAECGFEAARQAR